MLLTIRHSSKFMALCSVHEQQQTEEASDLIQNNNVSGRTQVHLHCWQSLRGETKAMRTHGQLEDCWYKAMTPTGVCVLWNKRKEPLISWEAQIIEVSVHGHHIPIGKAWHRQNLVRIPKKQVHVPNNTCTCHAQTLKQSDMQQEHNRWGGDRLQLHS